MSIGLIYLINLMYVSDVIKCMALRQVLIFNEIHLLGKALGQETAKLGCNLLKLL